MYLMKNNKLSILSSNLSILSNKLSILSKKLIISSTKLSIISSEPCILVQAILVQRYYCAPNILYYINHSSCGRTRLAEHRLAGHNAEHMSNTAEHSCRTQCSIKA